MDGKIILMEMDLQELFSFPSSLLELEKKINTITYNLLDRARVFLQKDSKVNLRSKVG